MKKEFKDNSETDILSLIFLPADAISVPLKIYIYHVNTESKLSTN